MNITRALSLNADTPFMVIDLEQVRKNIEKVQNVANFNNKTLRPHSKTHKIPEIAIMQVESGSVGVCVQKTAEAEIMYHGGVNNILLSNETYGNKFLRLSKLSMEGCELTVAVDNRISLEQYSKACSFFGVKGNVMVDVNIGMNRCGIYPDRFEELIYEIRKYKNLSFTGIMAYDGHVNDPDVKKREAEVRKEEKILEPMVKKAMEYNRDCIVSVGGTPTFEIWAKSDLATELQPGTYIYYDMHCVKQNVASMDEIAMGVVSTAISEEIGERIVLDAGYKSVAIDQGVYPTVVDASGNQYPVLSMSEEHTVLKSRDNASHLGERFFIYPYHACTTTDLWDYTVAIEAEGVSSFVIRGRGKRE